MAQQTETQTGRTESGGNGSPVPQPPQPEVRRRSSEAAPVRRSVFREHPVALTAGAIVFVVLVIGGIRLWGYLSSFESTDDAEIDGHIFPISSRVNGRVVAVNADANQTVKAGQILVSQRVVGSLETRIEVVPLGSLDLRGFHNAVPTYNLVRLSDGGAA